MFEFFVSRVSFFNGVCFERYPLNPKPRLLNRLGLIWSLGYVFLMCFGVGGQGFKVSRVEPSRTMPPSIC